MRFPAFDLLPGHGVGRQEHGPIDLDPVGAALDRLLGVGSRSDAAGGYDGEPMADLLLDQKTMNGRHRIGRGVISLSGIVIRCQTEDVEGRIEEGFQCLLERRGRPKIQVHIVLSDPDHGAEDG